MKRSDKPNITDKELITEVANRTGLPFNATFQTIYTYYAIVKECIENGVEVKMGELGTMSWKVRQPCYGAIYHDFATGGDLPPMDTPGFWTPVFHPREKWKAELKDKTRFWKNEEKEE